MGLLDKLVGESVEQVNQTNTSVKQLDDMFRDVRMQKIWKNFNKLDDRSPEGIKNFQKQYNLSMPELSAIVHGEMLYKNWDESIKKGKRDDERFEWEKTNQKGNADFLKSRVTGSDYDNEIKKTTLDYFKKHGYMPGKKTQYKLDKDQTEALRGKYLMAQGIQSDGLGNYQMKNEKGEIIDVPKDKINELESNFQEILIEGTSTAPEGIHPYNYIGSGLDEQINRKNKPIQVNNEKGILSRIIDDVTNPERKKMRENFQNQMVNDYKKDQTGLLENLLQDYVNKINRVNQIPGGA